MITEISSLVKFDSPDNIKDNLDVFKKMSLDFRKIRKLWTVSSDKKSMTWVMADNVYYWSNIKNQPSLKSLTRKGPFHGKASDDKDTDYYLWSGPADMMGTLENKDIVNRMCIILGESITTTDVEKNYAAGHVPVIGMIYRRKKRKNRLTGQTVVHEKREDTLYDVIQDFVDSNKDITKSKIYNYVKNVVDKKISISEIDKILIKMDIK